MVGGEVGNDMRNGPTCGGIRTRGLCFCVKVGECHYLCRGGGGTDRQAGRRWQRGDRQEVAEREGVAERGGSRGGSREEVADRRCQRGGGREEVAERRVT